MKNVLITLTITLVLNGCATNSKMANVIKSSATCGVLTGLIGYFVGEGKGAAIGFGAGALVCGAAAYAYADDFTKAVVEQDSEWRNSEIGAVNLKPRKGDVTEQKIHGKTVLKIKRNSKLISTRKMISGNHLAPNVANKLSSMYHVFRKEGGNIHIKCPSDTTRQIMNEIRQTGATCTKSNALNSGYVVIMSSTRNKRHHA